MNPLLVLAMAAITLALAFYTVGVFGERRSGTLKGRHLALFWLGFLCDTAGTATMTVMAQQSDGAGSALHAVSGTLAIVLMAFHAVWASVVLARGSERLRASFHRLSIGVWLFWLVPYGIGMLLGIPAVGLGDAAASGIAVAFVAALGGALCIRANLARRKAARPDGDRA